MINAVVELLSDWIWLTRCFEEQKPNQMESERIRCKRMNQWTEWNEWTANHGVIGEIVKRKFLELNHGGQGRS